MDRRIPLLHGYIHPIRCEVTLHCDDGDVKVCKTKSATARFLKISNERLNRIIDTRERHKGWQVTKLSWVAKRFGIQQGLKREQYRSKSGEHLLRHEIDLT
jgi:hypothetical protein